MPDLTPPFPFRPPAARTVEEKSPVFCERYLHQLYCGALLESQRRRVLHGENVLKPGQWLPPPSSAQNHLCAALFMTLWLQRAHGGSTSWKDQHWPQSEQKQLWLLTSELWHTDRASESIPNTATSSAGLDSTDAAGRLWWPSPVNVTTPRVNLLQKSRFLKRFREGAYKRGNLSP